MRRVLVILLAALQLWVPAALQWNGALTVAAGKPVTPSTQAQVMKNATDGQDDGTRALTYHQSVVRSTQIVEQDANDASTTSFDSTSGTGQFNIKEFGIGNDSATVSAILLNTYNNPSTINDVAKKLTRNLNEAGCRSTSVTYLRTITTLTVTPVVRTLVNGAPASDTLDTSFNRPVNVNFPTIGVARKFEVAVKTPTAAVPGSILKYQLTPFTVPSDGSYFTINHQITGSAGNPVVSSFGKAKNGYAPQTIVVGNGGTITVSADLYKVDRVFTAQTQGVACPADPVACVVNNVDMCPGKPASSVYADVFSTTSKSHKVDARALLMDVVSSEDYDATNDVDMLAIANRGAQTLNGSDPVFTEVFTGCTTTASYNTTTLPVHTQNIQTCAMPRIALTNTCTGQRGIHFVHLQSQAVKQLEFWKITQSPIIDPVTHLQAKDAFGNWMYTATDLPTPYSGAVDLGVATFGGGSSGTTDLGGGYYAKWSTSPAALSTTDGFSYSPSASADGGLSYSFSSYGTSGDNWTLSGGGSVSGALHLTVYTNIYQIVNNTTGCDTYLKLAADSVCTQRLSCTDNRGPCTTLDGVTFCDGSGPAAGIVPLLLPWGVADHAVAGGSYGTGVKSGGSLEFLPRMCWAATGAQMDCAGAFSGGQQCYTDINGVQHCNTVDGSTLANNFGEGPDFADNCAAPGNPLSSTPGCTLVSNNTCAEGAQGLFSGECYNKTVAYDCGTTKNVTIPGGASYTQSCGGPIRCLGTECHNPAGETNTDFGKAVAATTLVSMASKDLLCAESGAPPTDATSSCTPLVFGGKQATCKIPVGSGVGLSPNCCKESDKAAVGAPNAVNYLKLIYYSYNMATNKAMLATIAKVPGLDGFSAAFYNAGGTVKSAIDGAITSTKTFVSNSASTALNSAGLGPANTVPTPNSIPQSFVSDAPDALVGTTLSPAQMEKMYNMLTDMGMPELRDQLMTQVVDGSTASVSYAPTDLLNQATLSMDVLQTAFMAYAIASLIGHIIFQCEKAELELGTMKKEALCHYVGGYCATKALGIGCIESRESYCCYKSALARILAEQIRTKAPWVAGDYGSAKSPACGGFTPTQLGAFDWSLFDPTEWVAMLQDAGIIPNSASSADTMYAENVQRMQFQAGSSTSIPNLQAVAQTKYAPLVDTYVARRDSLAQGTICTNSPNQMPWYSATVTQDDIVRPLVGTGSATACGVGCIEIALGRVGDNYLWPATCGELFVQDFSIQVDKPEYITKAELIGAAWDDHLQIVIGGSVIYQSPNWVSGPCDLKTNWCMGATPGYNCASHPSNDPGLPLDITSAFKGGGVITTQSNVKVGGGGEGYALVRVYYTMPSADRADCTPAYVTPQ